MSTRGAYGFFIDGKTKVAYNHCDSYPSGLGQTFLDFANNHTIEELIKLAKSIKVVSKDSVSTDEEINKYAHLCNLSVSEEDAKDWYCLLREMQGEPELLFENPIMLDAEDFLIDSLFCEYAYIINLDDLTFEVYSGFNKESGGKGRYAKFFTERDYVTIKETYYGVELIRTYSLFHLPNVLPEEGDESNDEVPLTENFLVLWNDQAGEHFEWTYSEDEANKLRENIEDNLGGEIMFIGQVNILKEL